MHIQHSKRGMKTMMSATFVSIFGLLIFFTCIIMFAISKEPDPYLVFLGVFTLFLTGITITSIGI